LSALLDGTAAGENRLDERLLVETALPAAAIDEHTVFSSS
jgi:hypothetical protein